MKIVRFITLMAAACVVLRTLAEPVYSLNVNGHSVQVNEFDEKYDYALCTSDDAAKIEVTRLDGKPIASQASFMVLPRA